MPAEVAKEFSASIADAVRDVDPAAMTAASGALTESYRTGVAAPITDGVAAAAYAAVRAPATFAAASAVLGLVAATVPSYLPSSHLDIGAGVGSAAWAAAATWPQMDRATLMDRSNGLVRLGREIQRASATMRDRTWDRIDTDLASSVTLPASDLVTACYSLGELEADARARLVRAAWEATTGVFVAIEPGTPTGYSTILEVRDALITAGASLVAPCPHELACPLMGTERWCHFPVRLQRSVLHRTVKDVDLPYEDERFSYVTFTRLEVRPSAGRVIGHPRRPRRQVHLDVCAPSGVLQMIVGRSQRERYRIAKEIRWGDEVPPELTQ